MTRLSKNALFEITPKIAELAALSEKNNEIDKELYTNTK